MAERLAKAKACRACRRWVREGPRGWDGAWHERRLETPQRLWTGQMGSCPSWEVRWEELTSRTWDLRSRGRQCGEQMEGVGDLQAIAYVKG